MSTVFTPEGQQAINEILADINGPDESKPKTKKTSKKKAVKPTKKRSALGAAVVVLKQCRKPLSCKEMIERMAKNKLWKTPSGATPHLTLSAAIIREIVKKGEDSRFVKTAPGRFAAK